MALPKINTVQYDLKLPSSGKKIEYRPFLVKEEKILLIALERALCFFIEIDVILEDNIFPFSEVYLFNNLMFL